MKLYRVSLEANYVDFVAYVEATDRDDAYKKGSEIIADDYAQYFLTEDRKTVEELEDLYYSFHIEEAIPGDHFAS